MAVSYDSFYQTENLFGDPYPELIDFFATYPRKGKVLDLGCGQGRDAIPLARLGYEVMGVDHSKVLILRSKYSLYLEYRSHCQFGNYCGDHAGQSLVSTLSSR